MSSTCRPRSLRAAHRLAALLVGVFWCAAPILASVHANAEVHRYCAEHGKVEEAVEPGALAQADTRPAAHDGSQQPPGHDGCAFARVCRFGQVFGQGSPAWSGDFDPTPLVAVAPAEPAPPLAVLSLAPKTSPPV